MFAISGAPTQAFVDALKAALDADAALMAMIEGVYGHLSEAERTSYPYLVLGQRHRDPGVGVMGMSCSRVTVQIDGWSDHQGASEMHAMLSRVCVVLERQTLPVSGFAMVGHSLTCEFEDVSDEPDGDSPGKRLYRGIQRWTAEIHEP